MVGTHLSVHLGAVHVGSVSAQCSEALWVTEARLQAWDVSPVTILWSGLGLMCYFDKGQDGTTCPFHGALEGCKAPKAGLTLSHPLGAAEGPQNQACDQRSVCLGTWS